MDELSGKVAVITGAASGIGLATAKRLATEGMQMVLADIEPEPLGRAADEVRTLGVEAIGVVTDVASRDAVVALADAAFEQFDRVHFLFNNAGVAVSGPIAEMTHEDWKWTIDVDLWGPIHGVEVFLPRMIDQHEGGHIASTASFAGVVPNDGLGVYCVAKYGVVAMSEVLWRELREHNIGVSVLCPMRLATNIDGSGRNRQGDYGGPGSQAYEEVDEGDMAGDLLSAEDAAELVLTGIRENKLYLFTHDDSRAFIRKRFERMDRSFD
jgi:NAD(P)-dependent dehydrogenase (short-subunit alcohol dehydrogenase family)